MIVSPDRASMQAPLTIGHVARSAGVNVETIRYYQRLGLVPEPPKPSQGYRVYPPQAVDRITFIKRAQRLGFSLEEIGELLELRDGHCADVRLRAEAKRAQIIGQIRDLEALRVTLDTLIGACHAGREDTHCPIVETLARPQHD